MLAFALAVSLSGLPTDAPRADLKRSSAAREVTSDAPRADLDGSSIAYPLPALRIARLAVDARAQGRGIGELLKQALILARRTAEAVGCVGVVVDAKSDAVAFYERYGFGPATTVRGGLGDRPEPTVLFLPLSLIPVG